MFALQTCPTQRREAARPRHAARPAPAGEQPNALWQRLATRSPAVLPRLEVGAVDDPLEREADRVADAVMRGAPAAAATDAPRSVTRLQRCSWGGGGGEKCETCRAEEEARLQRSASGDAGPAVAPPLVHDVLASPGRPLDAGARSFFEPRFSRGFGDIQVHADARAAESARAVRAVAYTVGSHVVFGDGAYRPGSMDGRRLLAHELTHVVQQGAAGEPGGNAGDAPAAVTPVASASLLQRLNVEDCSVGQTAAVRKAAADAVPAIRKTISAILASQRSPDATNALTTYFGATGPAHAAHIALRLAIIAARIPRATIQCENPGSVMYDYFCENTVGYVRPGPAFFGFGAIHLCQPAFHNWSEVQRMRTIVHEAGHRYLDFDDEAYYTGNCAETAETTALSDSDRRDNADSYACLVQTLG